MFSSGRQFQILAVAVVATAIIFAGCSRDTKPKRAPMEFSGQLSGCLKGYADKARDYFDGKLSEKGVSDFFDCYHSAVDMFGRYVIGSKAGQYRPEEFKLFLETYFMAGETISTDLVRELVAFHGVILGTPEHVFTEQSLARTQDVFETLKRVALRLRPYMPITPASLAKRSHEESEAVIDQVHQAFQDLGSLFGSAVTSYSRTRFLGLVEESVKAFKFSASEAKAWRARADVLTELKPLLMNSTPEEFQPRDWAEYWRRASDIALTTLRMLELLQRDPALTADLTGVERMKKSFQEYGHILDEAITVRPTQVLRFEEFDGLFQKLANPEAAMGYPLQAKTGRLAVEAVTKIFLAANDTGSTGRTAVGLTPTHLRRMQGLVDRWVLMQRATTAAFEKLKSAQHPGFTGALTELFFKPEALKTALASLEVDGVIAENTTGEPATDGYLRDLTTIVSMPVMYKFEVPTAYVGPDLRSRLQSVYNLSMWTWIWVLYRSGFVGVATGPTAGDPSELSLSEFRVLYDTLWPIAVELKIFDPRVKDSYAKRFREANLFTSVANGDKKIQLNEAVEAATLMYSIQRFSFPSHQTVMDQCQAEHAVDLKPDPFGYRQATRECFRKYYFKGVREFWKRTPDFLRQYEMSGSKDALEADLLEVSNQSKAYNDRQLHNSIDTDSLTMVVYYTENLFVRFDGDRNNKIELPESRKMFQVFREFLRATAQSAYPDQFPATTDPDELEDQNSKLEALLTFALAKGRMPNVDSLDGKLEFLWWWKVASWDGEVNATRQTIVRLLEIMRQIESKH